MQAPRRAVAAFSVVVGLATASANAEIRTDRLTRGQLKIWKEITAMTLAEDRSGHLLHPTLHRLWQAVIASPHVVQIELTRRSGTSPIAGRFRIESLGPDGQLKAVILLNLRMIDRAVPESSSRQGIRIEALDRSGRRAQVFGHELAHAAWVFAASDQARLAFEVQKEADRLALIARTVGTGAPGLYERVQASERRIRLLEEPALAAESLIAAELRASGAR